MNALTLAALLAAPVLAQDDLPPLPEEMPGVKPPAEAPAQPAEAPKAPAAAPAKEAPAEPDDARKNRASAASEAMEAAPACILSGPAAEGKGCAGAYRQLADGYLAAYKAMDAWLASASMEVQGALDKAEALEKSFTENEAAITKLKLDRSKDAKARLKDLNAENKKIWKDLEAARKAQDAVCKGFQRSAAAKVKELSADLAQRLTAAQKAGL